MRCSSQVRDLAPDRRRGHQRNGVAREDRFDSLTQIKAGRTRSDLAQRDDAVVQAASIDETAPAVLVGEDGGRRRDLCLRQPDEVMVGIAYRRRTELVLILVPANVVCRLRGVEINEP
jgi:hypothetical protein